MKTILTLLTLALVLPPAQARASLHFTLQEVGPDVVMTGMGTLDLTGLGTTGLGVSGPSLQPNNYFLVGPLLDQGSVFFSEMTGPDNYGPGVVQVVASSGSGDLMGLDFALGLEDFIFVPGGYVSDAALSGSATFAGESFASLGVTPGTYTWTLSRGVGETISLAVGNDVAAVPELSSAIGWCGLAMFGAVAARFRKCRSRNA